MSSHVYVIAEAGVNHNGEIQLARELVYAAAAAGADAVKFQTFNTESLVRFTAPKAPYQMRTTTQTESQFEMLKRLELSHDAHFELKSLASELGLDFLSTPFDMPSLAFLLKTLRLSQVKLPSSDITNLPLLIEAGRSGASLILSTGMADLSEIESALKAIAYGMTMPNGTPSAAMFDVAYGDSRILDLLAARVTLLQCTSNYPASVEEANLRVIPMLAKAFGVTVGYSDHTVGIASALAAVALGAAVIEKHLTLDKSMNGPDHAASSDPHEFGELVQGVRAVQAALGSPMKRPSTAEIANRTAMRKGLHAARNIQPGSVLEVDDIVVSRPETKGTAGSYFQWLGLQTSISITEGEPISRAFTSTECDTD